MKPIPALILVLVLGLASITASRAQESQLQQGLSELVEPEAPTPATEKEEPLNDPFFGGGDGDMERAELRKAAHAALSRCRILARGAARNGIAAMLVAVEGRRNVVLRVGDTLTLNVDGTGLPFNPSVPVPVAAAPAGDVIDLKVIEISRQSVRFELPGGGQISH